MWNTKRFTHHIEILDWDTEVWVFLAVENGRRLENVTRTLDVDTGLVHRSQLYTLEVPNTPEQHLEGSLISALLIIMVSYGNILTLFSREKHGHPQCNPYWEYIQGLVKTIVTTFFIKQVTIVLLIWPITQTLYTTVNIQVMYLYSVCAEYWPDALGYRHDGSPVSLVGCCGHLQHWQIFTHHVSKWRQLKTRASIHRVMYN